MKNIMIAISLVLLIMLELCACVKQPVDTPIPTPSESPSSSETSSEDSNSKVENLGNIHITEKLESAIKEEAEKSVLTNLADYEASHIGYAEKEANALREDILGTSNTEDLYKIKGKKYYISPNGDDSNDGLTPNTALKSMSAAQKLTLNDGDAILFERGYVYRFKNVIAVKSGITYGSYGTGSKPAIYGSPSNAANAQWSPSIKRNVWYTDYLYGQPAGLFTDYGKTAGKLKNAGIGSLEQNGDFYHDASSGILYMYCDEGNPANVYKSIEISPSTPIFNISKGTENVVIDNITMKYGAYGIAGGAWTNVKVTNCEFGFIGGMVGESARRGNAVEIYGGPNKNVTVEHNWVYQTFDSAITWQGASAEGTVYENISFSNNLLEYNNADFEFWESKGVTVNGFEINDNIMRFTSAGWGTRTDDGGIRGIEGCFFGRVNTLDIAKDIIIKNNIMDCPSREIIALEAQVQQRNSFDISNNKVFVKKSYRTYDVALRGFPDTEAVSPKLYAKNLSELKNIMNIFDSTMQIAWYE